MATPRSYAIYYVTYLFLIPGFYLYQYAIYVGFDPFLRGYLVASSGISLTVFFTYYILDLSRQSSQYTIDWLFWASTIFFAIWAAYFSQYDLSDVASDSYMYASLPWSSYFLLGRTAPQERRSFRYITSISHYIMIAVVVLNTSSGYFNLGVTDITATYQAFALIFVVNFYFVISLSQNRALTAINILVGGATILVVGSRSEIVYIMSYVLFYVISSRYKLISFVAFAVVGIALSVSQTVLELFPRNRFYDLYETGAEGNRLARDYANTAAMRSIWEHPFVGDYANYEPGFYAHNIFSVWVDFGLAGFVLYGLCILVPAYLLIHDFRIGARSTQNAFAIANILACIVLLLTSKNGAYYAVPFAIGIAAYQHSRNLRSVPMRAAVA